MKNKRIMVIMLILTALFLVFSCGSNDDKEAEIKVPGKTLTDKFNWLYNNAEDNIFRSFL